MKASDRPIAASRRMTRVSPMSPVGGGIVTEGTRAIAIRTVSATFAGGGRNVPPNAGASATIMPGLTSRSPNRATGVRSMSEPWSTPDLANELGQPAQNVGRKRGRHPQHPWERDREDD